MTIKDQLGHFWLPETPDRKVAGLLNFSAADGGDLRLLGALDELDATGGAGRSYRVLGEHSRGGFTLDDCFQTRREIISNQQTLKVQQVFTDIHFGADETIACRSVQFDLTNLIDWLNMSGVESTIQFSEKALEGATMSVRKVPSLQTVIADGGRLSIAHRWGTVDQDAALRAIKENFFVRIDFDDPVELANLSALARDFQDLTSTALQRVAAFDYLTLRGFDTADGPPIDHPVQFHAQWRATADDKKRRPTAADMAFTFADIGGIAGVQGWMRAACKYRYELGRAIGPRYTPSGFASDRLMNVSAALEGFYRRHTGDQSTRRSLASKLKGLQEYAAEPFIGMIQNPKRWPTAAADVRNDIAHSRIESDDGAKYHFFAESLYWLFVLCMMRESQFPEAAFQRVAEHRQFGFIGQSLTRYLA